MDVAVEKDETATAKMSEVVGSWEPKAADLILQKLKAKKPSNRPFMVALVGIPGSGKSVSSFLLANLLEQHGYGTMVMPHDGYHYPLAVLEHFPDPADAIYRRGAPDTFDHPALLRDLKRIQESIEEQIITVPAFDHARGDPQPHKHAFDRTLHQIVVCEGLYLLHWPDISDLFDVSIFMDSDIDTCVERVKIRNRCIPGYTVEEINIRAERVDRKNAETVMESKSRADLIVESIATKSGGPGKKQY